MMLTIDAQVLLELQNKYINEGYSEEYAAELANYELYGEV